MRILFAFALLFSMPALAGSPSWAKACKNLGFEALRAPVSGMSPGWVVRKSDQEPFFTNCFTGKVGGGNSLAEYSDTVQISTQAELQAYVGKYAEAVGDFSHIKTITLTATGLREDNLTDIQPDLTQLDCEAKRLSAMVNLKSVLSFASLKMKIETKNAGEVKAVVNAIKTKIGDVDAKASVKFSSDDTIEASGTNLGVCYRAFKQQWLSKEIAADIPSNKPAQLGGLMPGVAYQVLNLNGGKFRLSSTRPGLIAANTEITLDKGIKTPIVTSGRYGAYLSITDLNDKSAKVTLEEWSVALGAQ